MYIYNDDVKIQPIELSKINKTNRVLELKKKKLNSSFSHTYKTLVELGMICIELLTMHATTRNPVALWGRETNVEGYPWISHDQCMFPFRNYGK